VTDLQPISQTPMEVVGVGPGFAPGYTWHDSLLTQVSRRRWLFAGVFTVTSAVLLTLMLVWPKSSRAVGQVVVAEEPLPSQPGSATSANDKIGDPADLDSQVLLLRSPRWQAQILDEPGVREALKQECDAVSRQWLTVVISRLRPNPGGGCAHDLAVLDSAPEGALQWIGNRLAVQLEGQSRVISVGYTSPLPEVAKVMTNALIDAYLEGSLEAKRAPREAAVEWLHGKISHLADDMQASEADIQRYRERNGLLRGQTALISAERLSELAKQMAAAQAADAEAQAKLQELQKSSENGFGLAGSSAVLASPIVANLRGELARVTSTTARTGYEGAANAPAARQRAELQAQLDNAVVQVAEGVRRDALATRERVTKLDQQMKDLGQEVALAATAQTFVEGRERSVNVDRELYVSLSMRANELETERRLLSGNARLVSHALLPSKPWFPKILPFTAVSFVLAAADWDLPRPRGCWFRSPG
jgi:polysaccharide biosynthesis transport protein